jgi:hypothetical protein
MSSPNQLSFLPDDYMERRARRRTNLICSFLFVCGVAGIGSAFMLSERADRRAEEKHATVSSEYVEEARRIERAKQIQEKQRQIAHQAELTASLIEKVPRSYLLAAITNAMPGGVSLLDLTLDTKVKSVPSADKGKTAMEKKKEKRKADADKKDAPPPPPAPKIYDVTIKLVGVASTDVQVAQFITKLNGCQYLKDVNLVISDEFQQENETLRRFQIDMLLNPAAEPPPDVNESKTVSIELEAK